MNSMGDASAHRRLIRTSKGMELGSTLPLCSRLNVIIDSFLYGNGIPGPIFLNLLGGRQVELSYRPFVSSPNLDCKRFMRAVWNKSIR